MPVVVFYGDDLYSIDKAVTAIVTEGEFDPVDVTRLDAVNSSAHHILMAIGTQGLFSSRRLILLSGLGRKRETRGSRGKAKSDSTDTLTLDELHRVTPESTKVVAIVSGVRMDSAIVKEVMALTRARSVESRAFPAPKPKDMPGWITRQARAMRLEIDVAAAKDLASRVGDQTLTAGMELEKLATAAEPERRITAAMVAELVPRSMEESIFPLVDAIADARPGSFALLERQLQQETGNNTAVSLPLIRLLARHFRILLQIQLSEAAGMKRDEITSTLKVADWIADRYYVQAKRLKGSQLRGAIEHLAAAEQETKNGEAGDLALELLVADLTGIAMAHA